MTIKGPGGTNFSGNNSVNFGKKTPVDFGQTGGQANFSGGLQADTFTSTQFGGGKPAHSVDFGAISQLSLRDAKAQFQAPTTAFGLSLF